MLDFSTALLQSYSCLISKSKLHTVWFIRDTFIRDIWRISEIFGDIWTVEKLRDRIAHIHMKVYLMYGQGSREYLPSMLFGIIVICK